MKKETIFRHELNESMAADAAMACLKNRNKHHKLNEAAPLAGVAMAALRPIIINAVRTLGARAGARMATSQLAKNVIIKIGNPETIGKIGKQIGQTWNNIPEELKEELFNMTFEAAKNFLTKKRTQEQEEYIDYHEVGHNLADSIRDRVVKMDRWDGEMYICREIAEKVGKEFRRLNDAQQDEIRQAAWDTYCYIKRTA